MTFPVHTQKSLDQLTWNEIQKLHSSLGLKATATTRTRRDYQRRIVEAQPQPVVETEQAATPLTCETCPLARHIDGNRYCCGMTDAVVRGHWEATTDCYDAVAAQAETETTEPATETATEAAGPEAAGPEAVKHIVTSMTCATCPLATKRQLLDNERDFKDFKAENHRYICGVTGDVVQGWFMATTSSDTDLCGDPMTDCYGAVAHAQVNAVSEAPIAPETEAPTIPATPALVVVSSANGLAELQALVQQVESIQEFDHTPPNRGDNGRERVTASTALQAATIVLPHATKPKADNNFMTAFTKESEGDRKFNDLAYLSQLEMEAQLAIERTVIGSQEEAIAYAHLRQIERDVEFYNRPESTPQPSPVIQQLETQMKELKADVFKLFKIEPFDQSILPACDESEQPTIQSEPEPEGTIHWTTPLLRGVIVGKKGATRQFYIRNDEIFIVLSGEFTASETKHPNIRHRQIREAIEAGQTFDPKMYKRYGIVFSRETENYNGIGRIKQGVDGRWWAWSTCNEVGTGHPFFSREIAIGYLEKVELSEKSLLARKINRKSNLLT